MLEVVWGLAPVFAVILAGYLCRHFGFPSAALWEPLERLVYFILFPALLVGSMATARFEAGAISPMLAAVLIATLVVAAALFGLRRYLPFDPPTFAVVFQASIRFNTYVGLGAAGALLGRDGVAWVAMIVAVMVPVSNVLSVLVLTRAANAGPPRWRETAIELARNPLILSCALGIVLNLAGIELPKPVAASLKIMGDAALALGLLAVGAALDPRAIRAAGPPVMVSAGLKLIALPALAAMLCLWLGASTPTMTIGVLIAALPPAPSAYVLTRRLGGDHALMAALITLHTLLAAVTVPAILALVR